MTKEGKSLFWLCLIREGSKQ